MSVVLIMFFISLSFLSGCAHTDGGNSGQVQSYPTPTIEAGWIRNGDPILFDGKKWFPVDDIESLMDSEVYQVGEHQGTLFFVDKVDTKPYNRLYTKFAKNKYRFFERAKND